MGTAFALCALHFKPLLPLVLMFVLTSCLISISLIDYKTQIIPDGLVGVIAVSGALYNLLYVPQGSENAYRNADVWNRFNTIEGFDVTGIDNATVAGELRETGRYSLDGRRLESPEKGINIVRMSDGSVRKVMVK